jgi:hypothetical protein
MASPTSLAIAVAVCASALLVLFLWRRRARRLGAQGDATPVTDVAAPPALEALSVHDKPTIEFSAYVEQLGLSAANDAPTRAFAAFDDKEVSTVTHVLDERMIEQLRGPESSITSLRGRQAMQTREISCLDIDEASTGLPRPSARTEARVRELVTPRKRQA